MDFYFPGHGKSGDLPPRKGFAEKWHPQLLKECPNIELTLLIGQYAQAYYLHEKVSGKVTERVKRYKDYLPEFFPLVHPSPRNQIWMAKNPWFESEVVPELKKRIKTILSIKRMKEIAFDAFYQLYQNEQLSLVDVREAEEFETLHLEGAQNLPLSQLADTYDQLDKDLLHYVICKSGMRSARACQFLAEQGYDIINVQGGMTAFENL